MKRNQSTDRRKKKGNVKNRRKNKRENSEEVDRTSGRITLGRGQHYTLEANDKLFEKGKKKVNEWLAKKQKAKGGIFKGTFTFLMAFYGYIFESFNTVTQNSNS